VLVHLDMSARWEPQARVLVVDQEEPIRIHNDEIRHKVLWWRRGFCYAENVGARIDPGQSVGQVLALKCVERFNRHKFGPDLFSHGRRATQDGDVLVWLTVSVS
jgi:hypothetical protein